MAHIGTSDEDWGNYKGNIPEEDLFFCKKCDLDFSLESDKISGKKIHCPVCKKEIKARQKNWQPG